MWVVFAFGSALFAGITVPDRLHWWQTRAVLGHVRHIDRSLLALLLQSIPITKGNYRTADNPAFEVFYLEDTHGVIAGFSGNPPYEF